MARIRYIKPSFFDNEDLGGIKPLARLLFIGLWCYADREGRLEDRPARLKKDVLGYDSCNVDVLLQSLHEAGFICRYAVDGVRLIQVLNFTKHQRPHPKEPPSNYQAPEGHVPAVENHGGTTPDPSGTLTLMENSNSNLDLPLTPSCGARGGISPAAQRGLNGSRRKRDQDAVKAEATLEERYLGRRR